MSVVHLRDPRVPSALRSCVAVGVGGVPRFWATVHDLTEMTALAEGSRRLVDTVTPLTLEVALAVQQELESHAEECEQLRRQEVEQARYHSDLARRRYLQVDPDNRLVADCLEADWNTALRALTQAQERYEQQRQAEAAGLTDAQRASILALAQDFPRRWNDPQTPARERKRMARSRAARRIPSRSPCPSRRGCYARPPPTWWRQSTRC